MIDQKINEKFQKILDGLPIFLANYVKRFLERKYDELFETEIGKRLLRLSGAKKYGIEFILNVLATFFEASLSENTRLKRFIKEIGVDAGPEISRRLINGIKEEIEKSIDSPEKKELTDILLSLEDKDLIDLLRWLYEKNGNKRKKRKPFISKRAKKEIKEEIVEATQKIRRLREEIRKEQKK